MSSLREREPGVWEVRVFVGRGRDGKPRQVSRTVRGSKRAAEKVAAGLTVEAPTSEGTRSVAQLLDLWQQLNAPRWRPASAINQASRARLIAAGPLGRRSVTSLRVEDVDRWALQQRAAGVGEASLHNQLTVLRAAFAQAVRWEWISRNPAALASPVRRMAPDRSVMSDEEVLAVISAAPHQAAAVAFRVSAATGARRAELAALQWADLAGDRLSIRGQIVAYQQGTRAAPAPPRLVREATKTGHVRTVTLDAGTFRAIDELRSVYGELGPWMLAPGDRPPSPDAIGWWWRHAREAAGIDPRWRLHDLRHWSATTAIGLGTDVRTVANRLGHANPAMTLKVYAHAFAAADAGAAEALGRILDR